MQVYISFKSKLLSINNLDKITKREPTLKPAIDPEVAKEPATEPEVATEPTKATKAKTKRKISSLKLREIF